MEFTYRENKIYYKFVDRKKSVTNIFLHGWGQNHTSLFFCEEYIRHENSLYIDLPPFGKSGKNLLTWSIFTYANMVIALIEKLKIEKFNLIGHSFGGRISIIVASICKEKTLKIVLIDSAGMKPKRKLSYHFKVWRYRKLKRKGLDTSKFGSDDYKNLDEAQRKVFVSIVGTHLENFLPTIKAKTLIIFGENDKTTPLYMARRLNDGIENSFLYIMKDAGHFCFDDNRFEFVSLLKNFVEGA